ncbi:hypothetical protein ONO57_25560, partial [Salmonella enterica subsp. enterica serovar Anatum]|nr:hypothetical protein [Salmonella enterica subsp. enterica serovar Anatum]
SVPLFKDEMVLVASRKHPRISGPLLEGDVYNEQHAVVSLDRYVADREPAEMVIINYSTQYPSGYDKVYSIRISDLEYAVRDANFN